MSIRIKALGVVVAAGLAMAVNASPASAAVAEFFSANYPATLTGTQTGQHVFTSNAGPLKCNVAKFTGTLAARSANVSVAPTYETCTFVGAAALVTPNGCTYKLEAGLLLNENEAMGGMSIECPAEKQIKVKAGECEMKILATPEIGFVDFTNLATEFEAKVDAAPINYTLNNKCGTPAGNFENGKLIGTYKVKGNNGRVGIN